MSNYDLTRFEKGCRDLGIELSEFQKGQFIRYYEYLIEKNKVMNLTAITEFDDVIEKHFLDSLSCAGHFDINSTRKVIDIGSGAGFPGIPLKIVYPELEFCLLDSLQKRIRFLEEVFDLLGLKGIIAVHGRAEEFANKKDYRESFDLCVSRAVSNLATLSEYCLPFVKVHGKFIAYKSGKANEEIKESEKAIKVLGGKIETTSYFTLPGTDIERDLIIIEKTQKTPTKYPRKAGTPAKEPIK